MPKGKTKPVEKVEVGQKMKRASNTAQISNKVIQQSAAAAGKLLTGTVVSTGTTKTVSIIIERYLVHPLYRKQLRRYTKLLAHDEIGAKKGQRVKVKEVRPVSKRKHWRVLEVIA